MAKAVVRFDVSNPRAEREIKNFAGERITRITKETEEAARVAILAGYEQGQGPIQIGLDLAGRIGPSGKREGGILGMNGPQTQWAMNYRGWLQSDDPADWSKALGYSLRDKRFDSRLKKAIKNEEKLPQADITRMVDRYISRAVKLRGETVARTETGAAVHKAAHEAFQQTLDQTDYTSEDVVRVWRSAGDQRVRDTHESMNGQTVRGLTTPFVSPSGARLMHPLDASLGAPPEEIINCRCDEELNIDFGGALKREEEGGGDLDEGGEEAPLEELDDVELDEVNAEGVPGKAKYTRLKYNTWEIWKKEGTDVWVVKLDRVTLWEGTDLEGAKAFINTQGPKPKRGGGIIGPPKPPIGPPVIPPEPPLPPVTDELRTKLVRTEVEDKALTAAMKQEFKAAGATLTAAELDAVDRYYTTAYAGLNRELRQGLALTDPALAKNLDTALQKGSLVRPTTMFRGAYLPDMGGLKVGEVFEQKGYASTTVKRATADSFAQAGPGGLGRQVTFVVDLPKGQSGYLVPYGTEGELILPRGLKFKITHIEENPTGISSVYMKRLDEPASSTKLFGGRTLPPGKEYLADSANWKTELDAKEGFFYRHGINSGMSPVATDADRDGKKLQMIGGSRATKEESFVERMQQANKTFDRLVAEMPGFAENLTLNDLQISTNPFAYLKYDRSKNVANGLYYGGSRRIELAGALRAGESGAIKWGQWGVGGDQLMDNTLRHELGHALEYKLETQAQLSGLVPSTFTFESFFLSLPGKAKGRSLPSQYANHNFKEYLAESFAAWSHPNYGKDRPGTISPISGFPINRIHPTLEKLFNALLKKVP
jgi:hypothetical protein